MSGIVGILQLDDAPVDHLLLEQMTAHMAFRGPDAQQTWHDGSVGLGHTLLRTTFESEHERQPFSLDDRLWIVADARVDGRAELIANLRARGCPVDDETPDVELILHAYDVWQTGCVEHLIGDFAFAIWDRSRHRLFCAHDQFGVVPFFYAQVEDCLIFGNTLDSLRLHPGLSDALNEQVIADMIIFSGNRELDTTIWVDIRRLPPAHTLTVKDGHVRLERYWIVPQETDLLSYPRAEMYVEHFLDVFRRAVGDRLRTRHFATQLTGGMDTTSVVATAHALLSQRGEPFDIQAYTVAFRSILQEQEGEYAALVADALGIPHHILFFEDHSLDAPPNRPVWLPPEPNPTMLHGTTSELVRRACTHSRVIFSGHGGDPILAPEPFGLQHLIARGGVKRFLADLSNHLRVLGLQRPNLGLRARLREWQGRQKRIVPFPEWLDPDFVARLDLRARKDAGEAQEVAHHRRREMPVYHYWVNLFAWQDPGYTGSPIRVYCPFFDLRLFSYALSIPSIPWFEHKALLRMAMRGMLPERVLQRPKTPLTRDTNTEHALALRRGPQPWQLDLADEPVLAPYVDRRHLGDLIKTPAKTDHGGYRQAQTALGLAYWLRRRSCAK